MLKLLLYSSSPGKFGLAGTQTKHFKHNGSVFRFLAVLMIFGLFALPSQTKAQTTIATNHINNNGNSLVTFNFQNTNAYDVIITDIASMTSATGTQTANVYVKPSAINGAPGAISAANGWILSGTGSYTAVANTVAPMLTGLNISIPAGATYGIAFSTNSLRYSTLTPGTYTFPGGGANLITGTNVSYGGALPPAAPTNHPRGFIGSVTFIAAVPCSGTPAPGNTTASANPVCPGSNFTLGFQNFTSGTGVTYQWQSADDAAFTVNVTNLGTSSTQITSQTSAKYYRASVTCNGNTTLSNPVQVTMSSFLNCYCTSGATNAGDTDIGNITFGSLNNGSATPIQNNSGATGTYTNNTALPAQTFEAGATYPISVSQITSGTSFYAAHINVFIDYNQDGVFNTTTERVFNGATTHNGSNVPVISTITGSVTIPATATTGQTRMRVIVDEAGTATSSACGSFSWGETEDYLINIVAPTPCSTPDGGTAIAGTGSFCGSGSTTITSSGFSFGTGTSYMWESSLDNFATAGVPTGNTTPASHSTGNLTQTTYYRLATTCAATSSTDYSNYVTVEIKPIPTASASSNGPVCEGATLNLMGMTNIGTAFAWTGPGGYTSTDQNPSIAGATPAATGTYVFTATLNGCSSTPASVLATVNSLPTTPTASASVTTLCGPGASNLSAASTVAATQIAVSEDFNSGAPTWTLLNDGGVPITAFELETSVTYSGHSMTNYSLNGSPFVFSNSDEGGQGSLTSTALISPSFSTLNWSSGNVSLQQAFLYWASGTDLANPTRIDYSTDGGTTWSTIQIMSAGTTNAPAASSATYTLPAGALNQPDVKVRFYHRVTWGYYWAIDNVVISGINTEPAYTWTLVSGDGLPATTNTANITVNPTVTSTYQVTVSNPIAANCNVSNTVTVTVSNIVASETHTNVSCFGGSNGSATISATGGVAPYTGTGTFTGLAAGTYSYTVTDANGCTGTVSVTIGQPAAALAATITSQSHVSCFGGSNGTLTVTPTGGTSGYTYLWSNGATTATATGLSAGVYNVTVTDANGCTTTTGENINQPASAVNGSTVTTHVACFGGATGAINLTPSGGTAPYTYNWGGGVTTEDRTGLAAGSYSVTITDANGCTATVSATVGQPSAPVSGTTVVTNVACFGGTTGAINLTPAGGTAPYTFNWVGGATTEDRTGLAAGSYSVTITDANNCTATVSVTVGQPAAAVSGTTVVTNVACFGGNTGAINLTPAGGTAPYTFNWGGGVTTEDRTNLAAGSYSVTITDANGCTGTVSVSVGQPASVVAGTTVVTNNSCFGGSNGSINLTPSGGVGPYTYNWVGGVTTEDRTGLAAGSYSVTITDANGCTATVSATVGQPASAVAGTTVVTNVACFGGNTGAINLTPAGGTAPYTFNWGGGVTTEDRNNLAAGSYSVTITDANGCTGTVTATVGQPGAAVSASASQTNATCTTAGSATVSATGGTGPYTGTGTFTGLAAGTYTYTVTDANGCTATTSVTITQTGSVTAAAGSNSPVTAGGTISLTASGGTSYSWTGPNSFTSTAQNPTITNASAANAGTYSVMVTSGSCSGMATTVVSVTPAGQTQLILTIDQTTPASGTNFQSFGAVASYLNTTGVTLPTIVNVVPGSGPYNETVMLSQIPGSSATNTITINGNGNVLNGCATTANRAIIRLDGTDNIAINGLTLNATCNFGWGFHLMGDVSNVTISNNTINLSASQSVFIGSMVGVVASNSGNNPQVPGGQLTNVTVSGNTVNNGYYGMRIAGAATGLGTGLVVSNNTLTTPMGYGIDVRNMSNPTVSGNDVTMRTGAGYLSNNSAGIVLINTESGLTVTGNSVNSAGMIGMLLQDVSRNSTARGMVANNMIGGNFQNTQVVHAVQLNNASYLDIFYNSTLADNGASGSAMLISNQFSQQLDMRNNSFMYQGANGYALQANNGNSNFIAIDNNNYYTTGARFVRFAGADRLNMSQLVTAPGVAGHNMQSMSANPLYMSNTNLHLQAGSPLISQAAAIPSVTVDYDGASRTNPTDIGADEYGVQVRQAAELMANVYPNPFHNQLVVKLSGETAGDVQVILTDLMGRQVLNRSFGVQAGTTSLELNLEQEIAQGVYLLQVTQGQATAGFRVVKQ